MTTRILTPEEIPQAPALTWEVFLQFEAPEYPPSGVDEFERSIHDPDYLSMLSFYGAFEGQTLVGVLATRSGGSHIALFFVKQEYHRRGIGRALFDLAKAHCPKETMTVNSSPYAVSVYHHLGFEDTDTEQITNGLRYTPMEYRIGKNGGNIA